MTEASMADDAELFARAQSDVAAFEAALPPRRPPGDRICGRSVRVGGRRRRCGGADLRSPAAGCRPLRPRARRSRRLRARHHGQHHARPPPLANRQRALVARLSGADLLDADDTARIDAALDAARAAPAARDAVDSMPRGEGDVFRLVASGASPSEAAAALGITPGAARVRLSRARHRIRARMATRTEEHRR